ncbi:MAG: hypothetical protein ABUS48_02685 [Pseudomonadota bacterium]
MYETLGTMVVAAALVLIGVAFGRWRGRRDSAILAALLVLALVVFIALSRHALAGRPAWEVSVPPYYYSLALFPVLAGVSGFVVFPDRKRAMIFSLTLGAIVSSFSLIIMWILVCLWFGLCV